MPFLHTISREIQFRTSWDVEDRQNKTMVQESKNIIKIYIDRGFKVVDIHEDQYFKWIVDEMPPASVEIVATDDHVDEVERLIILVKERCRCIIHRLPCNWYTKLMIIKLVCTALKGLNQIPVGKGVWERISPLNIVTGLKIADYNKLQARFGEYAQVYE